MRSCLLSHADVLGYSLPFFRTHTVPEVLDSQIKQASGMTSINMSTRGSNPDSHHCQLFLQHLNKSRYMPSVHTAFLRPYRRGQRHGMARRLLNFQDQDVSWDSDDSSRRIVSTLPRSNLHLWS